MMNDDVNQLSSHLDRDKRSMDRLEDLLIAWGLWRNEALPELTSMTKSTLHAIQEMNSGAKPKKERQRFMIWDKIRIPLPITARGTSSQTFTAHIPDYWVKKTLSRLDRAIDTLPVAQRLCIRLKYEKGLGFSEISKRYDWPRRTYNDRIKRAKKNIKKNLRKLPEGCINI